MYISLDCLLQMLMQCLKTTGIATDIVLSIFRHVSSAFWQSGYSTGCYRTLKKDCGHRSHQVLRLSFLGNAIKIWSFWHYNKYRYTLLNPVYSHKYFKNYHQLRQIHPAWLRLPNQQVCGGFLISSIAMTLNTIHSSFHLKKNTYINCAIKSSLHKFFVHRAVLLYILISVN